MKLDVHVRGRLVAKLYRERDYYVLKYLADVDPADFISLTMPVREEPWRWPRDLHPFFRQNLPEGYLLNVIREDFAAKFDGTDLSLLAIVGGTGIGRVAVTPEGVSPGTSLSPVNIKELITGDNTADHFAALVRHYARAAISGTVAKFTASGEESEETPTHIGKPTIRTSHYIVKGSDDRTPYLGFNEYYTMRVLEQLDVVPVAETRMSDDGRVLIVNRFDVDENAVPVYGVEDACSLLGLPPHEKYATTTEKVLNATRSYIPRESIQLQLERLGWLLLTNYIVRNADCHAKNVALYYTSLKDVAYTPAYDIVTTQAYPAFANNPPGLSIGGRKTWRPGKSMKQLFNGRLGITSRIYTDMVEQLCDSASTVGKEVIEAAKNEPRWHEVGKQMVHAWNQGIKSIRDSKVAVPTQLDTAIKEAKFSDLTPPDNTRARIGRSPLLGKRGN